MTRPSPRTVKRVIVLEEVTLSLPSPARLGVVSDTHISNSRQHAKLEPIIDFFRRAEVDLILHAGDVGSAEVILALEEVARVAAVRGNADPPALSELLPDRVNLEIGARRVAVQHGHQGRTAVATARSIASPDIDLLIFGHSHMPLIERVGETILFNPGSPTERNWSPHFGVGLITVSAAEIVPDLILFDDVQQLHKIAP